MKPLDEYIGTWSGLLELVSDEVAESADLDFKRDAYADARKPLEKREEDKDELRRDAAAFANSGGGVLLIGVAEDAQGRVGSVPGIEAAAAHENFVREVLSRFIEPPFAMSAIKVSTVFNPQQASRGGVVVEIAACEQGLPHAVHGRGGNDPLDFWIRTDKSKRRMTYLQLRAMFRSDAGGLVQQSIDAQAIAEIHKIGYSLAASSEEPETALGSLDKLRFYTEERGYGHSVRMEVIRAAREALGPIRYGICAQVAEEVVDIIERALPYMSRRYRSGRELTKADKDLLQAVSSTGWDLAYDGVKYLRALPIVGMGSKLMGTALKLSHLNNVGDLKARIIEDLERLREMAEVSGFSDAVRVLDYQRDQAFEDPDGPLADLPLALDWAILGRAEPHTSGVLQIYSLRHPGVAKTPQDE
jgi:hypothetical protein